MIEDIKSTRKNIDKEFSVIFEQAKRVATKVGTQLSIPHIATKQVNRDNTDGDCRETYYRRVFAISFIDKIHQVITFCFKTYIFNTNCY